jgi:hypothetical protein
MKIEEYLKELVESYGMNKKENDDLKKIVDNQNKEIKSLMESNNLKKFESDNYKVSYSVSTRDTIDEELLLSEAKTFTIADGVELKSAQEVGLIKTKEYVDMDVLESLMYKGGISEEDLMKIDKCRDIKTVETLRVSRIKEKK